MGNSDSRGSTPQPIRRPTTNPLPPQRYQFPTSTTSYSTHQSRTYNPQANVALQDSNSVNGYREPQKYDSSVLKPSTSTGVVTSAGKPTSNSEIPTNKNNKITQKTAEEKLSNTSSNISDQALDQINISPPPRYQSPTYTTSYSTHQSRTYYPKANVALQDSNSVNGCREPQKYDSLVLKPSTSTGVVTSADKPTSNSEIPTNKNNIIIQKIAEKKSCNTSSNICDQVLDQIDSKLESFFKTQNVNSAEPKDIDLLLNMVMDVKSENTENNTSSVESNLATNYKSILTDDEEIQLIPSVLSTPDTGPWVVMDMNTPVVYIPIEPGTPKFDRISHKFKVTTKGQDFKITKIEQVQNPTAFGQFLLKKDELESRYGRVEVELLFHGSTEANINKICEYNFNWRNCVNSRYGRGVSFSPIATHATHCCDKTHFKQMLFCLVLVAKESVGTFGMSLPDVIDEESGLRCDTAIKDDEMRSVIVKFSDNEFYPLYRFHFNGVAKPRSKSRPRRS